MGAAFGKLKRLALLEKIEVLFLKQPLSLPVLCHTLATTCQIDSYVVSDSRGRFKGLQVGATAPPLTMNTQRDAPRCDPRTLFKTVSIRIWGNHSTQNVI